MALTGELSDLSLAELIEFFCNQRKTGRIEVTYPNGPAAFYLQSGAVVHAEIGALRGIEAVYYSLTQANASFTFNSAVEAPLQTINQPWTSVVLEGLRRMDEGVAPPEPFLQQAAKSSEQKEVIEQPIAVEAAPVVQSKSEPTLTAPEVIARPTPMVEPEPNSFALMEVLSQPLPVIEAEPEPIVGAPKEEVVVAPMAPQPEVVSAPVMKKDEVVQPAPVKAAPKPEEKPKPEKNQKEAEAIPVIDVEPAGILSYHPKAAPPEVKPIFAEVVNSGTFSYGPWKLGVIFGAVVLVIAVVAVPWGWYARSKAAKANPDAQNVTTDSPQPSVVVNSTQDAQPAQTQSAPSNDQAAVSNESSSAAVNNPSALESENKQTQPKENRPKPKTSESALNNATQPSTVATSPPAANSQPASNASRKVTVQVTYDENGRVTQASGGDATALRIARQKRFPAGKAGSATITIPIN